MRLGLFRSPWPNIGCSFRRRDVAGAHYTTPTSFATLLPGISQQRRRRIESYLAPVSSGGGVPLSQHVLSPVHFLCADSLPFYAHFRASWRSVRFSLAGTVAHGSVPAVLCESDDFIRARKTLRAGKYERSYRAALISLVYKLYDRQKRISPVLHIASLSFYASTLLKTDGALRPWRKGNDAKSRPFILGTRPARGMPRTE